MKGVNSKRIWITNKMSTNAFDRFNDDTSDEEDIVIIVEKTKTIEEMMAAFRYSIKGKSWYDISEEDEEDEKRKECV